MTFQLSDNDFLSRLPELFRKYNLEKPVDKAYLNTDRGVHLPSKTVWLKGYLFN